jgi:hypothetical protein
MIDITRQQTEPETKLRRGYCPQCQKKFKNGDVVFCAPGPVFGRPPGSTIVFCSFECCGDFEVQYANEFQGGDS